MSEIHEFGGFRGGNTGFHSILVENCIKSSQDSENRRINQRFPNSDNEVDGDFSWCCYVLRLTSVNHQQDVLNKIVDPVLKMAELRLMDGRLTVETLDELALKIGSGMAKFTTTNGKYSISFQD